ncbi:MAG: PD-(D/E)XK nuclease family protein [Bacteroidales bacterium]
MTFKEEKSFFEHLRFADSERVHSEFFSWILSSECHAISESDKVNFIEGLFKLEETSKVIKAGTEIDNIDIFIETNNTILIIENKLKSSQHSNQLERYKNIVEKKHPTKRQCFVYLTLVKEQRINNGWIHVSYYDILQELEKLTLSTNRHSVFVEDYILYLSKLLSVLNDVIAHPNEFAYVFENGSLKKSNKLQLEFKTQKEEFIAKNQLETIFQKAFLTRLLENNEIKELHGFVTDTRGTALIDFPLKRDISIGGKRLYTTFIQIQGDNIKFAFAIQENYGNSKREWISKIIDIFKKFKNQKLNGYLKINSPKELAYVSISKKMDKPYWLMSFEEIALMISTEIKIGHELTKKLMSEIENTLG